ncbi:hypothetical protein AB0L00_17620 [Actinoallomurus sp. NPDC052308]|uniref:hypothetical protein n=1 Tax=Actinoallomurus sp. NPDC052308 TaxID=3155530 RepID=UPI0034465D89
MIGRARPGPDAGARNGPARDWRAVVMAAVLAMAAAHAAGAPPPHLLVGAALDTPT